jgi:hypothetical protein
MDSIRVREIARVDTLPFTELQIFVEQLDADPFLGVVTERERYYLFVWDEEGFRP